MSAIGYLAAGLAARRARGIAPFTVLSCDNLPANGQRLRRAILQYAERIDTDFARWIETEVAFPCSMVDSITPATDAALRERVATALGCRDAWPVQRERYTQWVIEDRFCNARPPFEQAGVTLSNDIAGYDRAKLRLLNGAHSTLAWLGSLLELETVGDAMRFAPLAGFVERLMRDTILPAVALPAGLDGDRYIDDILARFRNPAIHHKLSQICLGQLAETAGAIARHCHRRARPGSRHLSRCVLRSPAGCSSCAGRRAAASRWWIH